MRHGHHETKYSGREDEMDLIGSGVIRGVRYDGKYKNYSDSLKAVESGQPVHWNPEDPPASFPNDLHFFVQEGLEKAVSEEAGGGLRLLDAVDSHLDRLHGVDLLFEVQGNRDSRYKTRVTVDITSDPNKHDLGAKADVVLFIPSQIDYPTLTNDEKKDLLQGAVDEIVSGLKMGFQEQRAA